MISRIGALKGVLAAAAVLFSIGSAVAEYPTKPVTLVAPGSQLPVPIPGRQAARRIHRILNH